jgi:hypothetical protein
VAANQAQKGRIDQIRRIGQRRQRGQIGPSAVFAPHSLGGVVGLHSKGAKKFTVIYAVSKNANTSCAEAGNAGTDSYVYAYNGHQMFKKSGTPPKLPKVIVGT